MEITKTKAPPAEKPAAGLVGDISRLKTNSAATVAELREFLANTKGKSPQQVMGMVAGSNLLWSTLIATAATAIVMAVFTAGPYAVSKVFPEKKIAAPDKPAAAPAKVEEPKPAETAAAGKPAKSSKDKALQAMDMDEAKVSDPKKNPLEDSSELDDLLNKSKIE